MNAETKPSEESFATVDSLGPLLGLLLLRVWLGVRALLTGVEKFAGSRASERAVAVDGQPNEYGLVESASEKSYSLANYHGVPAALKPQFEAQPLIPDFALGVYDAVLGPALLLLGLSVLLGVAPRISLFLMGLLYTSLTLGLILIGQDAGIAWLAVHIGLIALALIFSGRDRLALGLRKW